ncbi:hypothetical protein QBC39DRAFT_353473 [Podospora conica]|nr:hypothetical protein QBC39DRAFT_353473 [Schizothecium conicum]
MCKGTIEEYCCTRGLMGDALCPSREPIHGYVTPYRRVWRQNFECCGQHPPSGPQDCPALQNPGNLSTVYVYTLECEACESRIKPAIEAHREQRLQYLAHLDRRRRIALPRLQWMVEEGETDLSLEDLLWGDGSVDETEHVARACWEAEQEEVLDRTVVAELRARGERAAEEIQRAGEEREAAERAAEERAAAERRAAEERAAAEEAAKVKKEPTKQEEEGSGVDPNIPRDPVNWSQWIKDDDDEEE